MKEFVTIGSLNMRKGASTDDAIIQAIPSNKKVKWTGYSFYNTSGKEWKLVEYNGVLGFCSAAYLKEVK